MLRHHAALASGKLTRVTSGVNLPPSEVIMSRQTNGDHYVANDTCKHGHDHSKEDIAIPLESGRKYHCPSEMSPRKHHPDKWKQGTLAEARAVGIPACELCFGIPR